MMLIRDLNLQNEVLPSFDFTISDYGASRLLFMLQDVPKTIAEVQERQAITKGIIGNWNVLESFTYRRLDLMEVYEFFKSNACNTSLKSSKKLKVLFRLFISESERNNVRSKLIQAVLLLGGIQVKYLNSLNLNLFPASFQTQLRSVLTFLGKLNLEGCTKQINNNSFTISKIVDLSEQVNALNEREVNAFWDFFFTLEAYWSMARGTLANGFTFPVFGSEEISIKDFYHPAIKKPVKNTLKLGMKQNVLLLTGPNMSGKSTLLKAVGICVYLAHVGFAVPASFCSTPFFNNISIAINLNDSLKDGYSHFMAEIENLKSVLNSTEGKGNCFAVFDELFKGTNIDDALEITKSTINGLVERSGSYFLISTHLLQLEAQLIDNTNNSLKKGYIECLLDNGLPRFSYRLKEGWSQIKIGKILFEKEGLTELLASKN